MSRALLRDLDPRHSLVAGLIWLVVALALSFAVAASVWAGRVAREIVVQQHVRRLVLETDQLASDLGQAVSTRLTAIRAASGFWASSGSSASRESLAVSANAAPAELFKRLVAAYPDLGWITMADVSGVLLATNGSMQAGSSAAANPWFQQGLKGPWIGVIDESRHSKSGPLLGDLSAPLRDSAGRIVGVIAAHLNWPWAATDVQRLSDTLDRRGSAQTLVMNRAGIVVVGPDPLRNRAWNGVLLNEAPPIEPSSEHSVAPRFERLPNGDVVLATRAPVSLDAARSAEAWSVQLSEPKELVYQRANALAIRILWISACLGAAMAILGTLGARHLTNRLKNLTRSAAAVGRNEVARIEVPAGRDEVAQLAAAFAKVLDDLRQERSELLALSSDLERRVAVRTREVERLAKESRYAAIARERLQIARDLHDTLAHSMMAMLSEVRLLRKLQGHDPASMADELARAEEVAHAGLNEARSAIAQMRVSSVRDLGLGPAISKAIERFKDRTGLEVEFTLDPDAARFGDERAEVIFRMTEEALRNIERHARATRVSIALSCADAAHMQLQIADDGVGFDTSLARPGHFGLIGLREQAQLIGAELQIESAPERGTILRLSLRTAPEAL